MAIETVRNGNEVDQISVTVPTGTPKGRFVKVGAGLKGVTLTPVNEDTLKVVIRMRGEFDAPIKATAAVTPGSYLLWDNTNLRFDTTVGGTAASATAFDAVASGDTTLGIGVIGTGRVLLLT